jgi:hypothetical protein
MTATKMPLTDFFNIPNALSHQTPGVGATASFDIHWSGPVTNRAQVTAPSGSTGELGLCQATMTWSASNDNGFTFKTDQSQTVSAFAQLGHVSNGVFAGSG